MPHAEVFLLRGSEMSFWTDALDVWRCFQMCQLFKPKSWALRKLNVTQVINDESASTGVYSKQKETSAGFSIPDSVKSFPSVHFAWKQC